MPEHAFLEALLFRADGLPGQPTLFLGSDIVKFQREIILYHGLVDEG
jgi:hypothetical protein